MIGFRGSAFQTLLVFGCSLLLEGAAEARPHIRIPVLASGPGRYVTLRDLAAHYDMERRYNGGGIFSLLSIFGDPGPGGAMRILDPERELKFQLGTRKVQVNDYTIWLNAPVRRVWRKWAITETDLLHIVDPLMASYAHLTNVGHRVVVLDPGHGGKDSGASGLNGLEEKDLVLDIARRVRVHLANAGLQVRMTRDNDRFIELEERSMKAANWKADLFVSIHVNASRNRSASGLETYILPAPGFPSTSTAADEPVEAVVHRGNRYDGANFVLGYALQKAMLQRVVAIDRGVKLARFVVLREAPCPAALVECGFISNQRESREMAGPAYRDDMGAAIAAGILQYVRAVEQAKGGASRVASRDAFAPVPNPPH